MEHDVLWGLFALQFGYVRPDALIAALQGWSLDRTRGLRDILTERHALPMDRVSRLDEAVREAMTAAGDIGERTTMSAPTLLHPPCRYAKIVKHRGGGLGIVFRARDIELHREVALKEIKEEWADHPPSRERFVREAEVTGRLEHPGIVPVYGLGTHPDGRPFYAMRFVEGETLADAIRRFHAAEGPDRKPAERSLAFRELLGRFLDASDAIAYAHSRGVIHRDIKPGNVMLGPFGETLVVDWGLAKVIPAQQETLPVERCAATELGVRMGTLQYMPPELHEGRVGQMGPGTDVYLLGATLYEILTGRPPHEGGRRAGIVPRASDACPSAPVALSAIAERAMSEAVEGRHPDVASLAAEVRAWLADEPVATFRAAVRELTTLVDAHPGRQEYWERLARAQSALGLVLLGLGRPGDAALAFGGAAGMFAALVAEERDNARLAADLASARAYQGQAFAEAGRVEESAKALEAAAEDFGRLQHLDPRMFRAAQASVMMSGVIRPLPLPVEQAQATLRPQAGADREDETGIPYESDAEPGGRFTGLRPLAKGGMSEVYLAEDQDLQRHVALKMHAGPDSLWRRQVFSREAQILAQLEHPNVVPIYGLGIRSDRQSRFMILRYMPGGSLADAIHRHHDQCGGEEGLAVLLRHFVGACRGVAHGHTKGVIHRDPKPANILLGEGGEAVVIDWGFAEVTGAATADFSPVELSSDLPLTLASYRGIGVIIGTPAFMSPEAATGEPVTPRSDVYSLGASLFQVLTGRVAVGESGEITEAILAISMGRVRRVREFIPTIPPELEAITTRAMSLDPANRHPSVTDLIRDLEAYLERRAP